MARRPKSSGSKAKGKDSKQDLAAVFDEVVRRTDEFCRAHLNEEYAELSRMLAENLRNEDPSPLLKGEPASWAAGIVYVVGWVNFLTDPAQKPHMKSADFYPKVGVSEATVQARSAAIRKLYDLMRMDPRLTLRSNLDDNPMVWMIELENGMIDDARRYPRSMQERMVQAGLIPYVHPSARDDGGDEDDGNDGCEEDDSSSPDDGNDDGNGDTRQDDSAR